MNTKQLHENMKLRGSADVTYLGRAVDEMIWNFMEDNRIPGLTLAIVQAPYIPRVVGYGLSDAGQRRLASPNTMWPAGPISQAFAAVAVMQLVERGKLKVTDTLGQWVPEVPSSWQDITVLDLLRHAAGVPDYRRAAGYDYTQPAAFAALLQLIAGEELHFVPGTRVEQSAGNFLLLTEIVERSSGQSYHDFVKENQIDFLQLRHTAFKEDLGQFKTEDVTLTGGVHQAFKADGRYIDPIEPAASYDEEGRLIPTAASSALRGMGDIWASAQDISYWDIGLAGSVLIHEASNRALVYTPWQLPDGTEMPAVAGWQFYKHRGLMDIKGSLPGYSLFLSRFTHAEELVCVTLMANKEGVDFTNLGRRIAGAFGDLLSTNYDDNHLFLTEGQLPVAATVARLEADLKERGIPLFAKFDHAQNAREVGLDLRPTTVLVFGAPKVGTGLMQLDQSVSLELPLRISVWEDAAGSTWLAYPRLKPQLAVYDLKGSPIAGKMEVLLEALVRKAANVYA